jgi:N-acylneuraminate cytidylyltransferase
MNVAFIPVRGGSKSIPLKNIKPISGKPLVYWTVKAACGCKCIDKVYVATDSKKIRETVESFKCGIDSGLFEKVEVIGRSAESASDTASTEFAMLEFANDYDFDNIALVQATSPLLQAEDLDRGFKAFESEGTDSVLSVVRQKRFHWKNDENGYAHPSNYDVFHRPRRQEFDGYLVENGAFYICSKADLIKYQNRVFGNIKAVEMSEDTFFEIDEPSDWLIIEALMKKNNVYSPTDIPEIKMFLTDCDGCLTDGGMYYSERGDELKKFNTRDGMGFSLLRQKGIVTGIVTSENVELNRRRAEKLKLDILEAGCKDKLCALKRICEERDIQLNNVCYVGDDINDIEVIKAVGYGCCPADALPAVKEHADYVALSKGGEGVIREIAEIIMAQYARLK